MKKALLYLSILFIFASCTDEIDLEFDQVNKNALVVEGYVTEGELSSKVTLRLTTPNLSSAPSPVPNNVQYVLLRRTDSLGVLLIDTLKEKVIGSGDYYSSESYTPQKGDKYQLEINCMGELFRAESQIKRAPIIDSINYFYQKANLRYPNGFQIRFGSRDVPGSGDFYIFEKYKNGKLYYEGLQDQFNIWDDRLTDGLTFPPPVVFNLNPSPNEAKASYDKNKDYPYALGDTVLIKALSIDDKAFRFYNDILNQSQGSSGGLGPLFAPPADNLRTNLYNVNKNGTQVVGLFSARGKKTAMVIIK